MSNSFFIHRLRKKRLLVIKNKLFICKKNLLLKLFNVLITKKYMFTILKRCVDKNLLN
nr:MAG TPA: hypothetical protein [Caudoviricetes sp.]